jgi:protocatechuate 3,4-dioxygenase beta subunit
MRRPFILFAAIVLAAGHFAGSAAGQSTPRQEPGKKARHSTVLAGRVLGPDNQPLPGVRLYFIRGTVALEATFGPGAEWPAPKVKAVTDAKGVFRFEIDESEARPELLVFANVLAVPPLQEGRQPTLGVAWNEAFVFDASGESGKRLQRTYPGMAERIARKPDPVLRLVRDDAPLTGEVRTHGGAPVANASVSVVELWRLKGETLAGWLKAVESKTADYDKARNDNLESLFGATFGREAEISSILTTTTDEKGRFRLPRVGRERIAYLSISGEGIVTQRRYARTRDGNVLKVQHVYNTGTDDKFTFYGANFAHLANPSVPIVGTIRDRDSGAPLAGIVVQSQRMVGIPYQGVGADLARTVTDAKGRYRLTGMPLGRNNALIALSFDKPYLPSLKPVEIDQKNKEKQVDWQLKRGRWVRGRVTDARTGEGIACQVQYYASKDNKACQTAPGFEGALTTPGGTYLTTFDGRFAVAGLPGEGFLAVFARFKSDTYPRRAGTDSLATLPIPLTPYSVHSVNRLNIRAAGDDVVQDIRLDPGETVRGTVLDPDGKPLSGAKFCGTIHSDSFFLPLPGSGFVIKQYFSDRPRTLLFYHPERKLSASLILRGPPPKHLSVRLQASATLTGRVVDDDGKPVASLVLTDRPHFADDPPERRAACPEGYYHTDKEGRFRVEGLAPGVKYNLVVPEQGFSKQVVFDVTVKAGETKDLGNVRIRPFGRP